MTKRTAWYSVNDNDWRYSLDTYMGVRERDIAEDAAEDYHGNHDGWEATWPVVIHVYETEDGPEVARYEVERESEPVFTASPLLISESEVRR